ncbi:CAAX prenyl protease 1 homolog [Octopus sinensis]|uniref:CAAX prenyl protease 1 homolog n=1 Tax=Octopus sinensis TaxID=2607531 RepID=A0A7E6EH70_9MOLL|nr:CAAX prenyl protease 1 homolog [Octopus sinensis]
MELLGIEERVRSYIQTVTLKATLESMFVEYKHGFSEILDSANFYKVYKTYTKIRAEHSNLVSDSVFEKSRLYKLDKSKFGFTIMSQQSFFLTILPCLRTLIFVPFSYYSDFLIEARHGFNKQTVTFFIKDKIKKLLLILFFGIFIGVVTLFIINKTGESFANYLTQFVFIVNLFYIYGEFIAPLFDTFRELPQSELRTRIEDLASSLNFPLHRLFVVEELLNILMVTATRYNEFGADRFSTMIGYGDYLQSALKKLYRNNLSFIYDDWLYAKLKYTHPPLIERLDAIINDSKKIS